MIIFEYEASIDLSQKRIQLVSSNSVSQSFTKYFYGTPQAVLDLSQAYNGLALIYYPL